MLLTLISLSLILTGPDCRPASHLTLTARTCQLRLTSFDRKCFIDAQNQSTKFLSIKRCPHAYGLYCSCRLGSQTLSRYNRRSVKQTHKGNVSRNRDRKRQPAHSDAIDEGSGAQIQHIRRLDPLQILPTRVDRLSRGRRPKTQQHLV